MKETKSIKEVAEMLKLGKVIGFPTETSYGLFTNAKCLVCIDQIFRIKDRPKEKTLSVIVKDRQMAEIIAEIPSYVENIFNHFYPGPLTLILNAKKEIPGITKDGSIALRISSQSEIQQLFESIDFPLTATSANISGQNDLYSEKEFRENYSTRSDKPDAFFLGGTLQRQKPTTIVDVRTDDPQIIRQGEVTIEDIKIFLT